ncbi:uncharacterized protein LOC119688697 [Teleopsis dalmanni]|uniref:uncharacterized protein LOC119688697 n=1 Tax=Teleopsis dalmanni TaxID=139649 RepID=UPI0018CDC178|nr:uncharacterized protein LOC119688697 [Teleopsis dalmanni]
MKHKSPLIILEEECKKRKIRLPLYEIETSSSEHFQCRIRVLDMLEFGEGATFVAAKHVAALNLLRAWHVKDKTITRATVDQLEEVICPPSEVIFLNRFCSYNNLVMPIYRYLSDDISYTAICSVGQFWITSTASNKSRASAMAAKKLLEVLRDVE